MAALAMKQWATLMATLETLTTSHPSNSLVADHLSKHTATRGHHIRPLREISILHLKMDKDRSSIHHNNSHHNNTHNNREAEVSHQVQEDGDHHLHICIRMAICHRLLK